MIILGIIIFMMGLTLINPFYATFIIGMLNGYSMKSCAVVYAQQQFETSDFSSNVYRKARNTCGMRVATKRKQMGRIGEYNGYAKFILPFFSTLDLFRWLSINGITNCDNPLVYAAILKQRGYYEAKLETYATGVTAWADRFNFRPLIWLLLPLSAAIMYKIYRRKRGRRR